MVKCMLLVMAVFATGCDRSPLAPTQIVLAQHGDLCRVSWAATYPCQMGPLDIAACASRLDDGETLPIRTQSAEVACAATR